jgi:hypothetical protein
MYSFIYKYDLINIAFAFQMWVTLSIRKDVAGISVASASFNLTLIMQKGSR